ncbi:MAG: RNase P subunit p30 family protein [Candidatus Bathyarchaeia archaeon]
MKTDRKYTDMHVELSAFKEHPDTTLDILRRLGFKSVAITYQGIKKNYTPMKIESSQGLELASRVQINPQNRFELLKDLRAYRPWFEVVGVKCVNLDVARTAVRDSRVDVVSFPLENLRVRFSDKLAKLCNAALEITVRELVSAKAPRHLIFRRLRKEFECAASNEVHLIVASGAKSLMELTPPMDLSSIPAVLGVETMDSLKTVSEHPYSIIQRNKMKLRGALIGDV